MTFTGRLRVVLTLVFLFFAHAVFAEAKARAKCISLLDGIEERMEQISEWDPHTYRMEAAPAVRFWLQIQRARLESPTPNETFVRDDLKIEFYPALQVILDDLKLNRELNLADGSPTSLIRAEKELQIIEILTRWKALPPTYREYHILIEAVPLLFELDLATSDPKMKERLDSTAEFLRTHFNYGGPEIPPKERRIFRSIENPSSFEWYIAGNGSFSGMNGFFPIDAQPIGVARTFTAADFLEMGPQELREHDRAHARTLDRAPPFVGIELKLNELLTSIQLADYLSRLDHYRRMRSRDDFRSDSAMIETNEATWLFLWHERGMHRARWYQPVSALLRPQTIAKAEAEYLIRNREGDMGVRPERDMRSSLHWTFNRLEEFQRANPPFFFQSP